MHRQSKYIAWLFLPSLLASICYERPFRKIYVTDKSRLPWDMAIAVGTNGPELLESRSEDPPLNSRQGVSFLIPPETVVQVNKRLRDNHLEYPIVTAKLGIIENGTQVNELHQESELSTYELCYLATQTSTTPIWYRRDGVGTAFGIMFYAVILTLVIHVTICGIRRVRKASDIQQTLH